MKLKLIALILALTLTCWAQSTTSTQASTPDQKSAPADIKKTCSCCDKMAASDQKPDQKEGHACMRHSASGKDDKTTMACCSGKDNAGCCRGKDGKSCAKSDQAAASCCAGMVKKGETDEMSCCSDKDGKTMTHDCCGGNQCGNHDHAAGN